jgi:hypothetical protein
MIFSVVYLLARRLLGFLMLAEGTSAQVRQRASWPGGRVLCTRSRGPAAIHLGLPLLAASCGLPASSGGPPRTLAQETLPQRHAPS